MYKRIIIIIGMIVIIILANPVFCQASDAVTDLGDLGSYGKINGNSNVFVGKVGVFLGAIQMLGTALSIICLIVLGIKYMMGSVEEKVAYKKTLLPYFIGAMMVFGITNLLKVVYTIVTNLL